MESINLNLIPSGVTPVCHVSQYDDKRKIRLNLFNGTAALSITATMTFELQVRKPDNTIVTTAPTGTTNNTYIDIKTTEQMTAVFGTNLCQLQVKDSSDSSTIGSLNFIMEVEADVLANGDPSQSEIHDLDSLIDAELTPYKFVEVEGILTAGTTTVTLTYSFDDDDDKIHLDPDDMRTDYYIDKDHYGVVPTDVQVASAYSDPHNWIYWTFTVEEQPTDVKIAVRAFQ